MSKTGFRSSLFGFNKDDVNLYLLQLQQEYSAKEQELILKLSKAESELEAAKGENFALLRKLSAAENELDYFKGKEAEIEKMSVSIGTMYLVAKQNADQMMHAAEQCAREINEFSAHQLEVASKAGEELNRIKNSVSSSAEQFSKELSCLSESLEDSKLRLSAELDKLNKKEEEIILPEHKENE